MPERGNRQQELRSAAAGGRTAALRCRWQKKRRRSFRSRAIGGPKRLSEAREWLCGKALAGAICAAVGKRKDQRKPTAFSGHRKPAVGDGLRTSRGMSSKMGRRGRRPLQTHRRTAPPLVFSGGCFCHCEEPVRRLVTWQSVPFSPAAGRTDCHSQCAHWLRNDRTGMVPRLRAIHESPLRPKPNQCKKQQGRNIRPCFLMSNY